MCKVIFVNYIYIVKQIVFLKVLHLPKICPNFYFLVELIVEFWALCSSVFFENCYLLDNVSKYRLIYQHLYVPLELVTHIHTHKSSYVYFCCCLVWRVSCKCFHTGVCGLQLIHALGWDAGQALASVLQWLPYALRCLRIWTAPGPSLGGGQRQVTRTHCTHHLLTFWCI